MQVDDIFRIYSMTKPIVSVAAMLLVEEGRLDLDAPVAKFIPAFAQPKVGIEKTGPQGQKTLELVDAQPPMTVRDLLRHTSGLTYGFFGPGLVNRPTASRHQSTRSLDNAVRRAPGDAAAGLQPGSTRIQQLHRRARPRGRSRLRPAPRRLPEVGSSIRWA